MPVLNWVELRTNVFGSEQKSLRAWQGSEGEVREEDMMGMEGERSQGKKLADTLTD